MTWITRTYTLEPIPNSGKFRVCCNETGQKSRPLNKYSAKRVLRALEVNPGRAYKPESISLWK